MRLRKGAFSWLSLIDSDLCFLAAAVWNREIETIELGNV